MKTPKQWWKNKVWNGCNLGEGVIDLKSAMTPEDVPPPFGWQNWAVPTINQNGPSCCGQAWANWMEMMVRRYIGMDALKEGEEIDGYAIWKRAREMFYNGSLAGGLSLNEGFEAMLDMGILPPGSMLVDIAPLTDAICLALQETPLVQGHIVHSGWYDPNPENGCIDHTGHPGPGDGGHATCLIGHTIQKGRIYFVSQNSWGKDYGMAGYFTMSEDEWFEGYIGQGPCTASMPDGWEKWDGWRKFVTMNAK